VLFLRNPENPAWDIDIMELRAAAQGLNLQIQVVDVLVDFEPALTSART